MFWFKEKHDKKSNLVFKTKSGIKRSRPQNVSSEQIISSIHLGIGNRYNFNFL